MGTDTDRKRIAVLGAGANGSCVLADLAEAGHDVVAIDQWPAHVEAMRADGLRIALPDREQHLRVPAFHLCEVATFTSKFDLVLLAVKAYDTRWHCELIAPYLAEDGLLVGLQNAMTAETIAAVVGPARTLGCVVELSSEIFTPGRVQRNTPPAGTWFGVGSFDAATQGREEDIAQLLRHVGKVSITPNVLAAKWMKVVVNTVFLGFFGALGVTIQEAARLPGVRELMMRIGTEALEVGQALGHGIEPIFGLTPEDIRGSNQVLEKLFDKLTQDVGPRARSAILQDHIKSRYSEVDAINGLVADDAARRGLAAPANAAVVAATKRIHAGEIEAAPANLDLIRAMLDGPASSKPAALAGAPARAR